MSHLDYLFTLEQFGIKLGLAQIQALVAALDHPERAFASVLVGGTNGKGSVTAMIERGLRAAGHRTGRYTSPHLVRLGERVAIDGIAIDDDALERLAGRVRAAAGVLASPPSFFEATTALAFEAFRDAGVTIAVLEVGLGGRLDATNVVTPIASAITAIDFDHEAILGHTLAAIAGEKAGIIKPGSLVVAGANPPDALDVLRRVAGEAGADLIDATAGVVAAAAQHGGRLRLDLTTPARAYGALRPSLRGAHQVENVVTAVRLLELLDGRGLARVPEAAVRAAVEDVAWSGRLDLVRHGSTDVIVDGAHNPSGARALARYVAETYGRPLVLVMAVMADKNVDEMIRALAPVTSAFVCTAPASTRAMTPDALAARVRAVAPDRPAVAVPGALAALAHAETLGETVVVAGSLYLAGEVLAGIA